MSPADPDSVIASIAKPLAVDPAFEPPPPSDEPSPASPTQRGDDFAPADKPL